MKTENVKHKLDPQASGHFLACGDSLARALGLYRRIANGI